MPLPCSSTDWDDIFAYKTSRRIVIRDRKLGLIRAGIIIGVFIYVVIFEVIIRRGYLVKESPVGFVRTSVLRMDWDSGAVRPYCCASSGCRLPAFGSQRGSLQCVDWDHHTAVRPPGEEFSVFITTRVTVTESHPLPAACVVNATVGGAGCPPWTPASEARHYVADAEKLSLMLSHGVHAREGGGVWSFKDMQKARLSGSPELNFCGGSPPGRGHTDTGPGCGSDDDTQRSGDYMALSELLRAAGAGDLDVLNTGSADTMRYDGVVILVFIEYEGSGINTKMGYKYNAVHVPGAEYKYEEVQMRWDAAGNAVRQVWNRHGVRVIIVQSGYVAHFQFIEMMKTLVVALSLLGVARFLVEKVFIPALPLGHVYKAYRDVKTVDFSDVSDFSKVTDDQYIYGETKRPGHLPSAPDEPGGAAAETAHLAAMPYTGAQAHGNRGQPSTGARTTPNSSGALPHAGGHTGPTGPSKGATGGWAPAAPATRPGDHNEGRGPPAAGDLVHVEWGGQWYTARVRRLNPSGTVAVLFEDGTQDPEVHPARLRLC